jgi:hypothetical protein
MKNTSIAAAVLMGIMTLATGTYALAADMDTAGSVRREVSVMSGSAVTTHGSDLTVMPGADSAALQLHFSGSERIERNFPGGLTIFKAHNLRMNYKPNAYQVINGKIKTVELQFRIDDMDHATIEFGKMDKSAPVIVKWGAVMSSPSPVM